MLEWAWPWMFLALPVPWLVARGLPAARMPVGSALRVPFALPGMQAANGATPVPRWRSVLAILAWTLLLTAAARPQWLGDAQELPRSGRDLLLAVDASGSMSTQDMEIGGTPVSRYAAVKAIAGDFIERRSGDRIGLIVFGSQAYMLTPLTFDRATVLKQLDGSAVGLPGRETAIGDAVGLAVKRLRDRPSNERVLILLTDGVNSAGTLDPHEAVKLATAERVKIYTIGIGADAMEVGGFFGSRIVNPSAQLDAQLLTEMAEKTGGKFFRARNTAQLAQIYQDIDKLEPTNTPQQRYRPIDELFFWPLSLALLIAPWTALSTTRLPRLWAARSAP